MKVELENILDIGTTLYSLDENFKIKRKVVVNIQSVFKQNVSHSPEIHTTYKVSNTMSNCYATDVKDSEIGESWFTSKIELWGINRNPEQYGWSSSPKVFANLYIDDAALGIPLIEPEDDRDYVDWNRVRDILITKNVI
jgi:hypothetical protein